MTDIEIVESIREGGTAEDRAFLYLYKNEVFRSKAKYIVGRYRGLRLAAWEDIFHEGLIKLITNIQTRSYDVEQNMANYFVGICNNTCRETLRKENKEKEFPEDIPLKNIRDLQTPLEIMYNQELKAILRALLERMTEKCRKALKLWTKKYSHAEIAALMEFRNAAVVGTTVNRCKNTLKTYVKNNSEIKKILKELRWI